MIYFIAYILADFLKWIFWVGFLDKLVARRLRHDLKNHTAELMLLHLDNEKIMEAINEKCVCRNCKNTN